LLFNLLCFLGILVAITAGGFPTILIQLLCIFFVEKKTAILELSQGWCGRGGGDAEIPLLSRLKIGICPQSSYGRTASWYASLTVKLQ